MDRVNLICPECKETLIKNLNSLHCTRCSGKWEIEGGIPNLVKEDFYWGEVSQEDMRRINKIALEQGWRFAIETELKRVLPNYVNSLTNENGCDWRFLLPLSARSIALDIGSGWGRLVFPLAKICGHVVSLELVKERLEFQKIRMDQEKISNIQLVKAGALNLPFPEESFDLIILDGVFEWLGLADESLSPNEIQKAVLLKIFNCLKKGGHLFIAIENRFGFNMFLGSIDHSGLRFTSLMPRKVADQYVKLIKRKGYRTERSKNSYRTYTYSYNGYKKFLKSVGFNNIDIYAFIPHYNNPQYMIPLDNNQIGSFSFDTVFSPNSVKTFLTGVVGRIGGWLNINKHIMPHFGIIAEK